MSTSSPICLTFSPEISEIVRARISYAFRVFAAIYGYKVVQTGTDADGEVICCHYGPSNPVSNYRRTVHIPSLYSVATDNRDLVPRTFAGEQLYLYYGIEADTGKPDWLGEIFDWISSSHERRTVRRDRVGRIPYRETIFGRQGISPRKPHAALLMAWLENELRNGGTVEALVKAPSPLPGGEHLVVCTHDIDFHYTNRASALTRLVKNLAISFRLYWSWSFFAWNSRSVSRVLKGKPIGDYLPGLLEALGAQGVHSTFFVVGRRAHRRDPNYDMRDIRRNLLEAEKWGSSVGVHGSYRSCIEDGTLLPEVATIEGAIGRKPLGNRQHWLRFGDHESLFNMVAKAELAYDSTLGFAETVGFRNGANFAFPPYDFGNECPYPFLEIPLVLMDGSLQAGSQVSKEKPQEMADEILRESRKWGWGGISALWHNPMEPIQVPDEINQVFWNCARNREAHNEKWLSAEEFLTCSLSRYQNAGLLEHVRVHA